MKNKEILLSVAIGILLAFIGYREYTRPKPCPVITYDTVTNTIEADTITNTKPKPITSDFTITNSGLFPVKKEKPSRILGGGSNTGPIQELLVGEGLSLTSEGPGRYFLQLTNPLTGTSSGVTASSYGYCTDTVRYREFEPIKQGKDTLGSIEFLATVTNNTLNSYSLIPRIKTTTITKVVTKTVKDSTRQLYAGLKIAGYRQTPFYGAGGSLLYKTKHDKQIAADFIYTPDGMLYQLGYYFKIKLK